jgi:PAS domain-containing protein
MGNAQRRQAEKANMKDSDKTKGQLIAELADLRQRVAELETSEIGHKRTQEKSRFQANALDQIGDAVIAIDDEERVTYLNSALALWGRHRQLGSAAW